MRARGVGAHQRLDRRGDAPRHGRGRPRALGGWSRPASAAYDGSLVLRYHVLWELTHVCFEHPGLLVPDAGAACDDAGTCITCSDEGTLAEVVTVDVAGAASVRTAVGVEQIDVNLVAPVGPGDLVLVHAGAAIAVVEASAP